MLHSATVNSLTDAHRRLAHHGQTMMNPQATDTATNLRLTWERNEDGRLQMRWTIETPADQRATVYARDGQRIERAA